MDDMVFVESGPSMTVISASPEAPLSAPENMHVGMMGLKSLATPTADTCERRPGHSAHGTPHDKGIPVDYQVPMSNKITPNPPLNHAEISPGPISNLKGQIQYENSDIPPLVCKPTLPTVNLPCRTKDQDLSPEEFAARHPPPPPPPALGIPTFPPGFAPMPHVLPPPPPPPITTFPIPFEVPINPADEVMSAGSFMSAQYSGDSILDNGGRVLRLVPFKRNVFVTRHRAYAADFQQHRWILQYGSPNFWYEKPTRSYMKSIRKPEDLAHLLHARPVSLETPRAWASRAMTTPLDDDVFDCNQGHIVDGCYPGTCHKCTDDKSDALANVPLVYYIVLSTCQASEPFIHGSHFNGCQIYKLVKSGSREAAVAEAFYASGVNGWNIAFSCVLRLDEDFEEGFSNVKKVEELWNLADDERDQQTTRVFY